MGESRGILADNLRALRLMHNLSQDDLARIAEVTRETVNKWESGAIGNIRNKNIDNIRRYFNLSIDDLRSESYGLAAQLHNNTSPAGNRQIPLVPVSFLADISAGDVVRSDTYVEILPSLAAIHPGCVAISVPDDNMARILPKGSVAIVEPCRPDAVSTWLENPGVHKVAVIKTSDGSVAIRRIALGRTSALLSQDGYSEDAADELVSLERLHIIGTVIWCQSAELLSS